MPNLTRVTSSIGALILLSLPRSALAQRTAVDTLQWLSGCWRMGTQNAVEEQWMSPSGGVMLGMSRTVRGGVAREHEFLRIYSLRDTLVYAAMPSGQQPTEFRALSASRTEVAFENPAHDFPQRIRYRLSGDLLIATIEGDREGKRQPVVFTYRRATCGAPTPASTDATSPAARDSVAATQAAVRGALQPKYDTLVVREMAYVGAMNSWFAEHADTSFAHVMWTASGPAVPVGSREVLATAGERMRGANIGATLRDRRFSLSIQRLLLRGDTADVLVTSNYTWVFADTAGRYGDRGASHERAGTQRRIDKWVRAGGRDWRLRQVAIIGDEVSIDGRVVSRDGTATPPLR